MKQIITIIVACFLFPTLGNSFVGINTNEVLNYNGVAPFIDLFRSAEPFKGAGVNYDQHGWPIRLNGSQASTYFLKWFSIDAIPGGNYIVKYSGRGKMVYSGGGVQLVSQSPGRDVIRFVADSKYNEIIAKLTITELDESQPIKNIQITHSGGICQNNPFAIVLNSSQCPGSRYLSFEQNASEIIFNPDYLKFMKGFKTIRFMNLSGIIRNPISSWSDRPKLTDAMWGGEEGQRGTPLEVMIKLANLLNADAWFNIPFAADDNYVRRHAQMVKEKLSGHLKAYIEYTNEAWNGIFVNQMAYLQQKALSLRLDTDRTKAAAKFYAKRSSEVFQLWKSIVPSNRLVTVLSGFTPSTRMTTELLSYSNVYQQTDVFAIAPYFYALENDLMSIRDTNDIFSLINNPNNRKSLPNVIAEVKKQKQALLNSYPQIKLVAYEGGQHFVDYKSKSKRNFPNPQIFAANKDPRMYKAYIKLINSFKTQGDLFIAFRAPEANAKFGSWGLKEHLREPDHLAPKYRAVKKYFGFPKPQF